MDVTGKRDFGVRSPQIKKFWTKSKTKKIQGGLKVERRHENIKTTYSRCPITLTEFKHAQKNNLELAELSVPM